MVWVPSITPSTWHAVHNGKATKTYWPGWIGLDHHGILANKTTKQQNNNTTHKHVTPNLSYCTIPYYRYAHTVRTATGNAHKTQTLWPSSQTKGRTDNKWHDGSQRRHCKKAAGVRPTAALRISLQTPTFCSRCTLQQVQTAVSYHYHIILYCTHNKHCQETAGATHHVQQATTALVVCSR